MQRFPGKLQLAFVNDMGAQGMPVPCTRKNINVGNEGSPYNFPYGECQCVLVVKGFVRVEVKVCKRDAMHSQTCKEYALGYWASTNIHFCCCRWTRDTAFSAFVGQRSLHAGAD
eukprot:scaffold260791_cov14-Tisochrysis_lutea.AAC.1